MTHCLCHCIFLVLQCTGFTTCSASVIVGQVTTIPITLWDTPVCGTQLGWDTSSEHSWDLNTMYWAYIRTCMVVQCDTQEKNLPIDAGWKGTIIFKAPPCLHQLLACLSLLWPLEVWIQWFSCIEECQYVWSVQEIMKSEVVPKQTWTGKSHCKHGANFQWQYLHHRTCSHLRYLRPPVYTYSFQDFHKKSDTNNVLPQIRTWCHILPTKNEGSNVNGVLQRKNNCHKKYKNCSV